MKKAFIITLAILSFIGSGLLFTIAIYIAFFYGVRTHVWSGIPFFFAALLTLFIGIQILKKAWINALATLNFLGFCFLGYQSYSFYLPIARGTWHANPLIILPLIIPALVALVCDIVSIKKRSWKWGVIALIAIILGTGYLGLYFIALFLAFS